MKKLFLFLLLAFSASMTLAQSDKNQPQTRLKNAEGVEKIDNEVNSALKDGDASALKQLLTDDFKNINSIGKLMNKKEYIADLKTVNVDTLNSRDLEVRLYGDTAVAVAVLSVLYQNGNNGHYFYTRVYVWSNDKWQMVSAHYTVQNR